MALTLNQQERKELIAALITNCGGWDQDDIDLLINMDDDKLVAHVTNCAEMVQNAAEFDDSGLPGSLDPAGAGEIDSDAETSDDEQEVDGEARESGPSKTHPDGEKDQPSRKKKPTQDRGIRDYEEPEEMTENEYLEMLPPRIQSVVINALNFETEQKRQIIGRITANSRNRFSPEYLMDKDLDELQAMADLASPRNAPPIFAGAVGGPTANAVDVDRDDILTIPTLEFALADRN